MTATDDAAHIQQLRATIVGLEEDLRTARAFAAECNTLLLPGLYTLAVEDGTATVVCHRCPIINIVTEHDLANGRPDVSGFNEHILEHTRRYHPEQES